MECRTDVAGQELREERLRLPIGRRGRRRSPNRAAGAFTSHVFSWQNPAKAQRLRVNCPHCQALRVKPRAAKWRGLASAPRKRLYMKRTCCIRDVEPVVYGGGVHEHTDNSNHSSHSKSARLTVPKSFSFALPSMQFFPQAWGPGIR